MDTSTVSSFGWNYGVSIGQTLTQHLEEAFKKWEDRIKEREEMKKYQEEQATLLLSQQLRFEELRKLLEEERTQFTAEKARLVEEQKAIQEQNLKLAQELREQREHLENKETQLAEAQQIILQLSTEKTQKPILSNKVERLNTDSPLMTSISSGFRCNDCFERLNATADCTYETPKITQFEIQSTKTIVT